MSAKRRCAALAVVALLAAACGEREGEDTAAGAPSGGASSATSTAPPADGSGPAAQTSTTRSDATGAQPSTATTREQSSGGRTSETTAPPQQPPINQGAGSPGTYARTLLRPQPATEVIIEVIVQPGAQPRAATVSSLEDVLEDVAEKSVLTTQVSGSDDAPGSWDEAAIIAYAERHTTARPTSSRAVVHFLALRGEFAPDKSAIGVAVRGDVFAVFIDAINAAGTPLVPASSIEKAVVLHELGHLLGLVDIAIDRNRDDPDHPFHSRNRSSVMFWAIETDLVGQVLGGPPPTDFDADDRADLNALRNGA
jgi:hypothetical protein